MNPLAAGVMLYLLLGLELAARGVFSAGSGGGVVMPSFVLAGVVMIGLFAPVTAALWTALLAGLAMDFCTAGLFTIVGPWALAYLAAAYFVVTVRGMLMRRSVLAWMFTGVVGAALAAVVFVVLMTARSWFDSAVEFRPGHEISVRLLGALYTAAVMAGLWVAKGPLLSLLGLGDGAKRGFGRMR
ncbi:hypothetical protein BH11PLA1_BH11PLA1_20690 [soil metagenome]